VITDIAVEWVEFRCPDSHWQSVVDYDVVVYVDADGATWEFFSVNGVLTPSPYTIDGAPCALCATGRCPETQLRGASSRYRLETTADHDGASPIRKYIGQSGTWCRCCPARQPLTPTSPLIRFPRGAHNVPARWTGPWSARGRDHPDH
jgi:hypothetical protein